MVVTIAYSQVFALAMAWSMVFLVAVATRADVRLGHHGGHGHERGDPGPGRDQQPDGPGAGGRLAGAAFFIAKASLAFWRLEDAGPALGSAALYFGVGLGAGVVLLALLPYIERVFGIVTNISLLELCDVNQPALRRLALDAPGTYTHSLLIGSLAEAAAEAIGANGLLARVGAYFHDIGKAAKPHYFVENWDEGENGHAGLSPAASRQVIMNHVKDGLEMADRVGLPPILKQFIAEHHGTTQMAFFYREAVRRQKAEGGPVPLESDYRYPGPKPRSRETAIVMLADAVEGATRSQADRSTAKVTETVHEMLMNRLLDGQLDQSGLTLTDLHTVEETLTKTLLSVYHRRVPYPTGHRAGQSPAAPAPRRTPGVAARPSAGHRDNQGDGRCGPPSGCMASSAPGLVRRSPRAKYTESAMAKIEITDLQDHVQLDKKLVLQAVRRVIKEEGRTAKSLSIVLTDNRHIRDLNRQYLGHDSITDVISFPLEDLDWPSGQRRHQRRDHRLGRTGPPAGQRLQRRPAGRTDALPHPRPPAPHGLRRSQSAGRQADARTRRRPPGGFRLRQRLRRAIAGPVGGVPPCLPSGSGAAWRRQVWPCSSP